MKKLAILILLVLPSVVFSQKLVSGTWIGGKPEIKSITAISRGTDVLFLADKLSFHFSNRGVDTYIQPSYNNVVITDNVNSKYAVTFMYTPRIVVNTYADRILNCQVNLIDIEDGGKIIGRFQFKGAAKSDKYASYIVDYMLK